jgi:hypothetical protein
MHHPYQIKGKRCPCCCGGEGFLVFLTCPRCDKVVVACDEIWTTFGDPKTQKDQWPDCIRYPDVWTPCPSCAVGFMQDYLWSTEEEIFGAGFERHEIELSLFGYDDRG